MDIKMLQRRNLKDAIKDGKTIQDLCEKYECSEEELILQINNLYSRNSSTAKELISEIRANAKKARPKKVEPKADIATAEAEIIVESASTEPTLSAEEVISEHVAGLEGLRTSEESLSREVMDLEAKHEAFAAQHRGCLAQLRVLRDEIAQIEEEYAKKCDKCDLLIQENNAYVEQMNSVSAELRERKAVLEEVRSEIAGHEKLIMFVYSGGEIYINDSRIDEGIELDEELYKKLRDKPECDELKQREIKTLTKMLTFVRNSTLTVEVTCENEDLEIAFLELV